MSINFTWYVLPNRLLTSNSNGNPNTVINVSYCVEATDGEITSKLISSVNLKPVVDAPFLPFEQLTEQQVLEWVKASVPAVRVTLMENTLVQRIKNQKKPRASAVVAAPWNTCAQG